jgi:hypothetical protein
LERDFKRKKKEKSDKNEYIISDKDRRKSSREKVNHEILNTNGKNIIARDFSNHGICLNISVIEKIIEY